MASQYVAVHERGLAVCESQAASPSILLSSYGCCSNLDIQRGPVQSVSRIEIPVDTAVCLCVSQRNFSSRHCSRRSCYFVWRMVIGKFMTLLFHRTTENFPQFCERLLQFQSIGSDNQFFCIMHKRTGFICNAFAQQQYL